MSNDVESGLSPLQKFVLRNWGLLGQDKIAAYLGIKPVLVKKIWASLGLPQRKPFYRGCQEGRPQLQRRKYQGL